MQPFRGMRKAAWTLLFCVSLSSAAFAQSGKTTLTGTVIDSDSIAWANATWSASLVNGFGNIVNFCTGQPIPTNPTGTLDSGGNFSGTLDSNSCISPSGTYWKFTIQSNTSAAPSITPQTLVNGASFNAGSFASQNVAAPRFAAVHGAFGYADIEVSQPVTGSFYFNVNDSTQHIYNGSNWAPPSTKIVDSGGQVFNVNASGAVGDGVLFSDCTIASGSAALSCPAETFSNADVNKLIVIHGAGPSSASLSTTIAAVTSAHVVQIAATASSTLSGLPVPAAPTVAPTCASACTGAYYYEVVAVQANGQTTQVGPFALTAAGAQTLDGTSNFNTVTTPAVPGASSCKVYRALWAGSSMIYNMGFIGSAVACGTPVVDSGQAGDGTAYPVVNSTFGRGAYGTDSTAAMAAVMNTVKTPRQGATVMFPVGIYLSTQPFIVSSNFITLQGSPNGSTFLYAGSASVNGAVEFQPTGTLDTSCSTPGSCIMSSGIRDLSIRGNSNAANALFIESTHHSYFSNLRLFDAPSCFTSQFAVADEFHSMKCTVGENTTSRNEGFLIMPTTGFLLTAPPGYLSATTGPTVWDNTIAEHVVGTGIKIDYGFQNEFNGGTSEGNSIGIMMTSNATLNLVSSLDTEVNAVWDVDEQGSHDIYDNMDGQEYSRAINSNWANFRGGSINFFINGNGAANTTLTRVSTNIVSDSGTNTHIFQSGSGNGMIADFPSNLTAQRLVVMGNATIPPYVGNAALEVGNHSLTLTPSGSEVRNSLASANTSFTLGQNNTNWGGMTWVYNSTAANAYLQLGAFGGNNPLVVQPNTGKVFFGGAADNGSGQQTQFNSGLAIPNNTNLVGKFTNGTWGTLIGTFTDGNLYIGSIGQGGKTVIRNATGQTIQTPNLPATGTGGVPLCVDASGNQYKGTNVGGTPPC